MPGRLAIDFGTSNTVVAVWDPERLEGVPLHISEYGRKITYTRGDKTREQISVVPSLIHYASGNRRWIGAQVLRDNLYESERTFRWMKRYISRRSPVKCNLDGVEKSHLIAGREFLIAVLTSAAAELHLVNEEVAFTVPVESFEHYENWLMEVAEAAGLPRFRLIDEPSAAALGYGAPIQPGDVYLMFDFGGGTLDVAAVLIEPEAGQSSGRRCRVLGKAGADIGGATIDGWIYQEILRQNNLHPDDDPVRQLSRPLLVECERVKEALSFHEKTEVRIHQSGTASPLTGVLTREQLEGVFDQHDAYAQIDHTIRRAMNASRERGYGEDNVKAVLMVGGSSLIPSVQKLVQRIFGQERVRLERPLDAVARGAAAFIAGIEFYDHIQHDYAIRFLENKKSDYDYRVIVPRGTPYPSDQPVARMTIKASHDGQIQLGIAIFELGEHWRRSSAGQVELTFDPAGAARVRQVTPEEEDRRYYFWVNESNPTFLQAAPPALKGEPRFEVEFGIDGNKRLLITARDLKTKQIALRDHPVIKLS